MGETNIFKVLADRQRRDILTMLKDGRLNAGEIAEKLQVSPAALSYHLKLLKSADLISEYNSVKKHVTASEFAEEVIRYSFAYGDDNEIHSCVLEDVKFICSVPYVVYETYYDVLKNFDSDKIFCVTSSNVHFQGECVLELSCGAEIKVNVFSFRSKVYGKIQLVCINEKFDAINKFFDREINGHYKCYLK